MTRPLKVAITCGEASGIGPEVALKALALCSFDSVEFILVGPKHLWRRTRALLYDDENVGYEIVEPEGSSEFDWKWGELNPDSANAAAKAVEHAAAMALAGEVDAIVTSPLSKEGLHLAGRNYPGHTEMLADICGKAVPTMAFYSADLIVSLVTTHLPLREVADALDEEKITASILACHKGLTKDLGIESPRIALCGLNPHAGEGGILGAEEKDFIAPAVEKAKELGIDVEGPLSADCAFYHAAAGSFDAVVALYHDQGLGPFKLIHFHDGVNMTMGLPIVRTSPDHGTAPDIAGRAIANPASTFAAIKLAVRIATNKRR